MSIAPNLFGSGSGGGGGGAPTLSGGGGGGDAPDLFGTTTAGARSAPKKGGGGFWGDLKKYSGAQFIENTGTSLGEHVLGLGPAAVTLGSLPYHEARAVGYLLEGNVGKARAEANKTRSTSQAIVKGAAQQYKGFYGHDLGGHIYKDPWQPILDALTVADVGAGAAAQAGKLADVGKLAKLGERGEVLTRSPREVYQPGTGGPVVKDITSTKPLRNLGAAAVQKVTRFNPDSRLHLFQTELRRWGKVIRSDTNRSAYMRMPVFDQYAKVTKSLNPSEWTALHVRALDVKPDVLAEHWAGTPAEAELTPAVRELALDPSKKMLRAEPVMRALSQSGAELFKAGGKVLTNEYERPGRFKTIVSKQSGLPEHEIGITGDPYYFPHSMQPEKVGSHPFASSGMGKAPVAKPGALKRNRGILFGAGKLVLGRDTLGPEWLRRNKWLKANEIHNALKQGSVRLSWDDIQALPGQTLPKGFTYLRPDLNFHVPYTIRAEGEVPLKGAQAAEEAGGASGVPSSQALARIMPNAEDLQHSELVKKGFTTDNPAEGLDPATGEYHIINKSAARAATGEFTRMSTPLYYFNKYPIRIWRALLLGTRPGFLTNNLIGNGLMTAAKVGGTGMFRDLFMSVLEHHGWRTAKALLDDHATPPALRAQLTTDAARALGVGAAAPGAGLLRYGRGLETPEHRIPFSEVGDESARQPVAPPPRESFYQRHYPEQMERFGSFGYTQAPGAQGYLRGFSGKAGKAFGATTSAIPKLTAKVAEGDLRRLLIRNFTRRSPEFKAVYRSMPKDTRSFEAAAERLHQGQGGLAFQRYVSREVDRSLGNYRDLSGIEQNVFRTALPFYAWYRAILSATFHLAVNNPLRANLLFQLGKMGMNNMSALNAVLPSYLQGGIPLSHGRILSTSGLNPWSTLEQLVRGSDQDVSTLGLNPFIQGALDEYAKETAHGGTANPLTMIAKGTENIFTSLPTSQLIWPRGPSKLYPQRNRETALWAWLGAPIKKPDPTVAAQRAAAGQ